MDYLNNLLQKPAQEIMKNPVQIIILLKYMEDNTITQEQKKKYLGKEYDFWRVLLEEKKKAEEKLTSAEKIRENNPNLEVEVNNEVTEKEEENKMENQEQVQAQEKGFVDKAKEYAIPIGGGILVGIGVKTVYDSWTKDTSKGSIVTDVVETASAFTDEF
jgi:hypothetical protein